MPIGGAPRWDPTTPVYDELGNYNRHPGGYGAYDVWNPVASAKEPDIRNSTIRNNINAHLEFKMMEGLTLKIIGNASLANTNNKSYYNSKTDQGKPIGNTFGKGYIHEGLTQSYQNTNILSYQREIAGNHKINITAVAEQRIEKFNASYLEASKFTVDQTNINDLGGAGLLTSTSTDNKRVLNSYLGRINYSFKDRYLLTVSYRADGSSVFGENNKWGYFPSASIAWRASEESFIKAIDIISDLKLRASWGVTGNQAISPYGTLAQMGSSWDIDEPASYPYNGHSVTDIGFGILNASNKNLKWESTIQTDIGLDFGLFKGRLNATLDIYKKTTNDLLLARELPGYSGYKSVMDNVGSVENKGIEISMNANPLTRAFKWNSGITFSLNRNKVVSLGETKEIPYRTTLGGYGVNVEFMKLVTGQPFGQMYGWEYLGTWKQSEAEEAARFGQLPGDPRYKDVDGNYEIDSKDIKVIGNSIPKFIYGWTNNFSFRNFELSFLIQGTKGNDIFNMARIRLENPSEGTSSRLLDRWTPDNQDTDVPAFIDQVTRSNAALTSQLNMSAKSGGNRISRWVEDGSYLRLKNITLSYNLPQALIKTIGMQKIKVFASGTNLLTITRYSGYDPEVSSWNNYDAQIGVDFANYPSARTYTLGLEITF
jgi:TonB-linked SusC/RagA family outer membrane protein